MDAGNFGSYFDPGLSGYWNYTAGGVWTKEPNIPCLRSDWTENQWHHVVIDFHRGPHTAKGQDIVYYDSVTFDNTKKDFSSNAYGNQAISGLGWSPAGLLVTNFQLDMGFTMDGQMTAYADLMKVTSPPKLWALNGQTGRYQSANRKKIPSDAIDSNVFFGLYDSGGQL